MEHSTHLPQGNVLVFFVGGGKRTGLVWVFFFVPLNHHSHLIFGERNYVGELLSPTNFIEERFIADIFTGITVKPSFLRRRIYFSPYMIYTTKAKSRQ